jgi:MOSC domain-containing protein YiiM
MPIGGLCVLDGPPKVGVADIDTALPHGSMGENLTLNGLLESDVWVGDVLRFPDCVLRVEQPREPCFKFNAAMGFNTAVKSMAQSGYCGFYLSVDTPGTVQAGASFELLPGPHISSTTLCCQDVQTPALRMCEKVPPAPVGYA